MKRDDNERAGTQRRPGAPIVSDTELAAELEHIERSSAFRRSGQLKRLLRHVVVHAQRGDGDRLKEIALGIEVLGRAAATFDPSLDPIVRVEVRRLRTKLARYYAAEGRDSSFEIDLPRGGYVPVLRRRFVAALAQTPSIAVLPFSNFTGDAARDAFCDGLTDELIDALAQVPGLRVVARTSAFRFKNADLDAREIARQLDVATLLEGSIQFEGSRIKVIAQLLLGHDGCHLWSQAFEADTAGIFHVQESIARDVVHSLQLKHLLDAVPSAGGRRSLVRRGSDDPVARDLYDRAMVIARTLDVARYPVAQRLLEEALTRDPGFARAHGILAALQTNQIAVVSKDAGVAIAIARTHLAHALRLDPELAQARALHGWILGAIDRDWMQAESELNRAVRASPGDVAVRNTFANLLTYMGRFTEAEREFALARELDPLHSIPRTNHALMLFFARRYESAIAAYRAILDLEPDGVGANIIISALLMHGRSAEALALAQGWAQRHPGSPAIRVRLAEALAAVGQRAAAKAQFAACAADLAAAGVTHWAAAHLAAILGDTDVVFAELDAAGAAGAAGESNFASAAVSPYFAPLHNDARWEKLIARHKLPRVPASAWVSSSACARDRIATRTDDAVPAPATFND